MIKELAGITSLTVPVLLGGPAFFCSCPRFIQGPNWVTNHANFRFFFLSSFEFLTQEILLPPQPNPLPPEKPQRLVSGSFRSFFPAACHLRVLNGRCLAFKITM